MVVVGVAVGVAVVVGVAVAVVVAIGVGVVVAVVVAVVVVVAIGVAMSPPHDWYAVYIDLVNRGFADAIRRICDKHRVTSEELLGRQRYPHIHAARKALWLEMREAGYSYPAIGALVGRDHTTVMSALRDLVTPAFPGVPGEHRHAPASGHLHSTKVPVEDL